MKAVSLILSSLSLLSAPILADETSNAPAVEQKTVSPQMQLGSEAVALVRVAYQNGAYDPFLSEVDAAYQEALSKNQLEGLVEMREAVLPQIDQKKWEEMAKEIEAEKNKELLSLVNAEDQSLFAQKVRSAAVDPLSSEERESLNRLVQLRNLAPKSGSSSDEDRLIEIDLEYEFKALHLDLPLMQGREVSELREKRIVLRMEKMKQMLDAAKSFKDEGLKQAVAISAEKLDAYLAQSWDRSDLFALSRGREKPANATEQKVASVLASYQDKYNELAKQFLDSF